MNKIIFFTRQEPKDTLAQYLRIKALMNLFSLAFKEEVILFNTYEPINKIKLILKTKKRIKEYLKTLDKDINIFVIDTLDPLSIKVLRKYANKNNIKVYIDIVEYADPKEKKLKIFSPSLILNHHMIKHSIKKDMTVIAISTFFINYFNKKNIKSILIPNLINEEDVSSFINKKVEDKVSFIFAGYPQKKDALDMIMLSLINLYKEGNNDFVFNIAGINEIDFFNKYPRLKESEKEIHAFAIFKGELNREEIKELYYQSDYSIVLRDPNLIVCQSGFPTKFTESLSYARPVIANLTSDIGLYLKDEYNGYIVNDFTVVALSNAIKKALDNKANRYIMFNNAYNTAKEHFLASIYIDKLLKDEE